MAPGLEARVTRLERDLDDVRRSLVVVVTVGAVLRWIAPLALTAAGLLLVIAGR